MGDAAQIAQTENVSGELFDLSIPSLNNEFGWEHCTSVMRHGISFPLKIFQQLQPTLHLVNFLNVQTTICGKHQRKTDA